MLIHEKSIDHSKPMQCTSFDSGKSSKIMHAGY